MRLSIRYKILFVLGLLLLLAVSFYTGLASLIFREEKTALLFDINHSIAVNAASQVRSQLERVGDELRLFVLAQVLGEHSDVRLPSHYLGDVHVLGMRLYLDAAPSFTPVPLSPDVPALDLAEPDVMAELTKAHDTRYALWARSLPSTRFFLAHRIELTVGREPRRYIAVAEVEAKPFFETLQATNLFTSYLAKTDGDVLFHCEKGRIGEATAIPNHPLLRAMLAHSASTSGFLPFNQGGESWYGAYAPVGIGGLVLLSQASGDEVESASRTLVKRSLLFGLIVLTLTFIASILFSKGLTRNLRALTEGARRIEHGDLEAQIRIRSRDEIQELASSFNAMTLALRASRQKIEQYNRELEAKVELRTRQLHETNAAIKEVQEKLLKATQLATVGEVAGRTAHEVLNPLTAILNRLERSHQIVALPGEGGALPLQFADIVAAWEEDYRKGGLPHLTQTLEAPSSVRENQTLFEEDLDNLKKLSQFWQNQSEVVAKDLEFVLEQAQRIHRIIDRMRELARSSVKSEVRLAEAVREALVTMRDFLGKRQVALEEEWAAKQDLAHLNRDEFVQILVNLIRNSFQAVETRAQSVPGYRGHIRVAIGNRHQEDRAWLVIDVVDNGVGIPASKRSLLFEQGFTTKDPSQGTGLGLAICRRYARAFGGEVELAYSEPEGRGTCFRVIVPLKNEASADPAPPEANRVRAA